MALATGKAIAEFVASRFADLADPRQAAPMAAYMKTQQPFLGVKKPERKTVYRELFRIVENVDRRLYEATVRALWKGPERELQYAAIEFAMRFKSMITWDSMPLFERLVREGAWWDLVDGPAIHLVGAVWDKQRTEMNKVMDGWIDDEDRWIRRAAIIGQNAHKDSTDHARLFRYCRKRSHEKDFFIRKAIGWALRDYSYTEPERVHAFLEREKENLSGLSYREGMKRIVRLASRPPAS